ncbi:histidine phosphatase family protein [Rhodococcus sp. BGS-1C]|jgi:broad specificity phosphatase PhoE|uniref:histidine phosphatase family protein n=1 Tax=Nocardiaceae TaxID=85025 RepID=UPI0019D1339E|nr:MULTISPECIES: histidine phosphatase family protein [Rhodococcus]MCZ4276316.1 histidine phosphatase family protein [Rhodococcus yunnanensis]
MTGRLVLVRHGQTFANVDKILDTQLPGAALTDNGHNQARRFGAAILETPPSILVTSPALRAVQTAENIAAITGIEPQLREGIHEAQAGEWEGRSDDDAHKAFTEIYGRWHGGDLDVRVPGGDSGRSILDRYVPVLDSLRSSHLTDPDGPDVVVVSHGAAIRLVAAVLGGVDGAFAADNHLDNTQTVALEPTAGGGWVCVRWGTYLAPFDGKGSRTADNPIS